MRKGFYYLVISVFFAAFSSVSFANDVTMLGVGGVSDPITLRTGTTFQAGDGNLEIQYTNAQLYNAANCTDRLEGALARSGPYQDTGIAIPTTNNTNITTYRISNVNIANTIALLNGHAQAADDCLKMTFNYRAKTSGASITPSTTINCVLSVNAGAYSGCSSVTSTVTLSRD